MEEMVRRLALDRLHDPARRQGRGHAQQQVDVIGADMALQNLDVLRSADFSNQVPDRRPDLTAQNWLAILRDEHEVVMQRIDRMS